MLLKVSDVSLQSLLSEYRENELIEEKIEFHPITLMFHPSEHEDHYKYFILETYLSYTRIFILAWLVICCIVDPKYAKENLFFDFFPHSPPTKI